MKILQKEECLAVSGGFCLANLEAPFHMGEGRNQEVTCYNELGREIERWTSRDWDGAKWYCCTCGRRGPFPYMSMNNRVYDCVNNKELPMSPSILENGGKFLVIRKTTTR